MSTDVEAARLRCQIRELEGRLSQHGARDRNAACGQGDREHVALHKEEPVAFGRSQALDSESINFSYHHGLPREQKLSGALHPVPSRVDIHPLAFSYKIRRLKQQKLVLEKLTDP